MSSSDPASQRESASDDPAKPESRAPRAQLAKRLIVSLLLMLPWPLIAAILLWDQFDQANEALLMLGGLTAMLLFPLILAGQYADILFATAISLVWLIAWLAPPLLLRRRVAGDSGVLAMWAGQTIFAILQVVMGALLIIGKSV